MISPVVASFNNATVSLSTTIWTCPGAVIGQGTETARQSVVPCAGTLQKLYVVTSSAQSSNNSLVLTIRVNGATPSNSLVVTIPAGAAAGVFSDLVNTVTVAAGDKIGLQIANNANQTSAAIIGWGFEISVTGNKTPIFASTFDNTVPGSTKTYHIPGVGGYDTTPANRQVIVPCAGTISDFYLRTRGAPASAGNLVIKIFKNRSATTVTVTNPGFGGDNVLKSDTTHSFTVAAGDQISVEFDNQNTSTNASAYGYGFMFTPDNPALVPMVSTFLGGTLANGTTNYDNPYGGNSSATETLRQVIIPSAGVLKNLTVTTNAAQPSTGSLVVTTRLNAGPTALAVTIAANAGSGVYQDTSNSFNVVAGDKLSIQYVNNATSTLAADDIVGAGLTWEVASTGYGRLLSGKRNRLVLDL